MLCRLARALFLYYKLKLPTCYTWLSLHVWPESIEVSIRWMLATCRQKEWFKTRSTVLL